MRYFFLLLVSASLFAAPAYADTENLGAAAHEALLSKVQFPSAKECGTCHPVQFKEWAASPHAYAQLSPVFNAMNATLLKLSNGTLGDFCIRCHTPIGMERGEPIVGSNLNRHEASLEGISCITCHRRPLPEGKSSGRFAMNHGDITAAVYGPFDGDELRRVIESAEYEASADADSAGRKIHGEAHKMDQITTAAFCGTCHDVNGANGFRLEEAFSEYKSSPAADKKVSCQDCHMGREPGVASGYATMPAAIVGGKPTKPRRHANHRFVGPDYSIVHPGIFPHSNEASEFASMREWIQFDVAAGWGADEFEDEVGEDYVFPERWQEVSERYQARDIITENQDLLEKVAKERKALLRAGYQLGKIQVTEAAKDGIAFEVEVKNGTDGHNVPTGFDAERVVFLRVSVTDGAGATVFQSGDLDPNGDLRDSHSLYVHNGELAEDAQLFSLQSKFVVNMLRGGEREQVLNINYSGSPLPFIRPPTNSTLLLGRPSGARKHRQTIPPGASRTAAYRVAAAELKESTPPYRAKVQLIAGMVPVNLVHAISEVGFDYGMSARQVADAVVAGHQVLWEKEIPLTPGEAGGGS